MSQLRHDTLLSYFHAVANDPRVKASFFPYPPYVDLKKLGDGIWDCMVEDLPDVARTITGNALNIVADVATPMVKGVTTHKARGALSKEGAEAVGDIAGRAFGAALGELGRWIAPKTRGKK